jgi:hypothetical protein
MKTSNIIILILLVCIPVFSFTYNWLLKEQFLSGNFTSNDYDPEAHTFRKDLPSFQHIVVDGVLKGKNRNVESLEIPWHVSSDGNHHSAEIKYPKEWEDIVYTSVRNDTLFISLEKEKISETIAAQLMRLPSEIDLTIPPIRSFTMINGKCDFNGNNITNDVTLTGKNHARIDINHTTLAKTEIILYGDSHIIFEENNQIHHLEYSLFDQTLLSISDQTNIEQWQPVYVDSLSRISITTKAKELQKQMAKMGGDEAK